MTPRETIEIKRPELIKLCASLGIPCLSISYTADAWRSITFVPDLDTTELAGYADRFFGLEEGLLRVFNRRVAMIERQVYKVPTGAVSETLVDLAYAA